MIIVAGGDSFVWGSELADETATVPSSKTFTALLATGHEYHCAAIPGASNNTIARLTVNACQTNRPDRVVVSWTFPSRYEFRFTYNTRQRHSPWYSINSWTIEQNVNNISREFVEQDQSILETQINTIKRAQETGVADFAQVFYQHVGISEYWEIYNTLKEIVYLQNYLKQAGIPYMFTAADNCILNNYTVEHGDVNITSLLSQIDHSCFFWFPEGTTSGETNKPRGFYQWALENKYKVGTTHPLEQAHYDAYLLMQDHFNAMD